MVILKGTLVREATVTEPVVLDRDVRGGIVLQTDKRFWVKDDLTGRIYIVELDVAKDLD